MEKRNVDVNLEKILLDKVEYCRISSKDFVQYICDHDLLENFIENKTMFNVDWKTTSIRKITMVDDELVIAYNKYSSDQLLNIKKTNIMLGKEFISRNDIINHHYTYADVKIELDKIMQYTLTQQAFNYIANTILEYKSNISLQYIIDTISSWSPSDDYLVKHHWENHVVELCRYNFTIFSNYLNQYVEDNQLLADELIPGEFCKRIENEHIEYVPNEGTLGTLGDKVEMIVDTIQSKNGINVNAGKEKPRIDLKEFVLNLKNRTENENAEV